MANGDATVVEKGLRELAVPFFHHEIVRQAVMQALHSADCEACMLSLLGQLLECGLVSSNQLAKVIPCAHGPLLHGLLSAVPATPASGRQALKAAGAASSGSISEAGLVFSTWAGKPSSTFDA